MSEPRKGKQPVAHCIVARMPYGTLVLSPDPFRVGREIMLPDLSGFREGDKVSIVMRRKGPARTAKRRAKGRAR